MTSEDYDRMRKKRLEAKRKREILGNVQFEGSDILDNNEGEENEE
jgi:hypothetical protein